MVNTWQLHELNLVAPNNAIEARFSLLFNDQSGSAGAIYLDAAKLLIVQHIPGDYNGNGIVDAADYTVWRDSFGTTGPNLAADGSGPTAGEPDGVVNDFDYDFWKLHFGASLPTGPTAGAVPEPDTRTILIAIVIFLTVHFAKTKNALGSDGETQRRPSRCSRVPKGASVRASSSRPYRFLARRNTVGGLVFTLADCMHIRAIWLANGSILPPRPACATPCDSRKVSLTRHDSLRTRDALNRRA